MKTIPVIYVAGPYSGKDGLAVELNVRRAELAAYALYRLGGVAVICPHSITRWVDSQVSYRAMCEATLELLRRSDAVLFVEGWENSTGSLEEYEEAQRLGRPTFFSVDAVEAWLAEWAPPP